MGPSVTFYPDRTIFDGTIDMKVALALLKGKGVLTGAEWINGLAFGVELRSGAGEILLKSWMPILG